MAADPSDNDGARTSIAGGHQDQVITAGTISGPVTITTTGVRVPAHLQDPRRWVLVEDWDALTAGAHRARPDEAGSSVPTYMARDADEELQARLSRAAQQGGLVLVLGESTAGKTRAAHHAVRACEALAGYRVLAPDTGRDLVIAVDVVAATSVRCVVWLDDLERFLTPDRLEAGVLAEVVRLRTPVLATMQLRHFDTYAESHQEDPAGLRTSGTGARVLKQTEPLYLQRRWTDSELAQAEGCDDPRIIDAVTHHGPYGVAEYLAAGPALLTEWRNATRPGGHPRGAALVAAAGVQGGRGRAVRVAAGSDDQVGRRRSWGQSGDAAELGSRGRSESAAGPPWRGDGRGGRATGGGERRTAEEDPGAGGRTRDPSESGEVFRRGDALVNRFQFVADHQRRHGVKRLCDILGIARSSFYYWRRTAAERAGRQATDARLAARIRAVHRESDATYGAPRITAELREESGEAVNHKRVARIMRASGIQGVHLRRRHRTTVDPAAAKAPDLIGGDFTAESPNTKYVGDITYLPIDGGKFCYLATVIDLASRRLAGWAIAGHMRADLVTDALAAAVRTRGSLAGSIMHTDHGAQYTSRAFAECLQVSRGPTEHERGRVQCGQRSR